MIHNNNIIVTHCGHYIIVCKTEKGERKIIRVTGKETKTHIHSVAQLRVRAQAPVFAAVQCCGGINTQRKTGIIFIS